MENKKIKAGILVLVSVIIFVLMYSFMAHKLFWKVSKNTSQEINQDAKLKLPETDCNGYASDEEANGVAIANKDAGVCDCIANSGLKNSCVDVVNDLAIYDKILSEGDVTICEKIKEAVTRESCISVGKDRMAYLEKMNRESAEKDKSVSIKIEKGENQLSSDE